MEPNLPPRLLLNIPGSKPGASLPWDAGGAVLTEPTYIVSGFSDTKYFAGANGAGTGMIGTVRIVMRTTTPPTGAQSHTIVTHTNDADGWYFLINVNGFMGQVRDSSGPSWVAFPAYGTAGTSYFVAGSLYVVHLTVGAGVGGKVRSYVQGAETAAQAALTGSAVASSASSGLWIGRYQSTGGLAATGEDVVSVCVSPTEMTPAQVIADAEAIMGRTARLRFPALPGEAERYVAKDLVAVADWHDRDGDDATLTKNGAPTVALLT